MSENSFHSGEKLIQKIAGESVIARRNSGLIVNYVVGSTAAFLQSQRLFFASSSDSKGRLWASVLNGESGFIALQDQSQIYFDPSFLLSNPEDIFWQNIENSEGVGFLFMDLVSRQRLRVNGQIRKVEKGWRFLIEQAYPNCPRYIQSRQFLKGSLKQHKTNSDLLAWLNNADTIFVASADENGHLDVSHRGGRTGFVKLTGRDTLRIPDYNGNSMFNTLGNFEVNPSAGILILDFSNGEVLQMTGKSTLHFDGKELLVDTGQTGRYWDFRIEEISFSTSLLEFSSRFIGFSPFNP